MGSFHCGSMGRSSPSPVLKEFVALLALAWLATVPVSAAHAQAKEVASYRIAVRLDPDAKRLDGQETITFLNNTSGPAQELYLHLYPNAFRGPDSTFMKENPSAARQAAEEGNWGGMEVTALRLASGADLLSRARVDDTLMRVPLPEPLAPGQSLQMEAEFSVKLVNVIARSGYTGDNFTIGQWFPKLAVLTDKGWRADQYHANGEFFADFGGYHVEITLPHRFVVGATGVQVGEKSSDEGTKTLTFEATNVHDFAWAANPTFREVRTRSGPTEIRLLYQPGHEAVRERFLNAAAAAVENFGRWYGPYPFPLLTVVDEPFGSEAGMEYPTFVTVSSTDPPIPGVRFEESVTIHETAHQWWYGMVANDEVEEEWLDESFATYSTTRLMDQLYGKDASMGNLLGIQIGSRDVDRAQYLPIRKLDPVVLDSWKFYSTGSWEGNVYSKGSLILGTLEGLLGRDTMDLVMRGYFERFAFRHPTTRDFIDTVNQLSGRNLERFFQQALYSTAVFDYEAEEPRVSRQGDQYRSGVEVRRLGDGAMPVDVVTTFADGRQQREMWDGVAGWQRYQYLGASPAIKVEVDPEHKLLLDARWANNSCTAWFNAGPILERAAELLWLLEGWLKLMAYAV